MEDMEDAIEGIFVDMIYQVLVGRREEERRKTEHN
jgi:5-carboxymethyl-2-hydroxymuconate isomerase